MEGEVFSVGFLENIKVLVVAILIYAIVYSVLKKIEVFGADNKTVNSLIALLAAVIVSFTGVLTYVVTYAVNWFVIIMFIIFLVMVMLLFFGIKFSDISASATSNWKLIAIVCFLLFSIIFLKGFFALNNAYDINNPQNDTSQVDTSFNTGVDDITNDDGSFILDFFNSLDQDLVAAALFLAVLGVFVALIG